MSAGCAGDHSDRRAHLRLASDSRLLDHPCTITPVPSPTPTHPPIADYAELMIPCMAEVGFEMHLSGGGLMGETTPEQNMGRNFPARYSGKSVSSAGDCGQASINSVKSIGESTLVS